MDNSSQFNESKIEKLKKRLFKKGEVFKEREIESHLRPRQFDAKTAWEEPSLEEFKWRMPEKPKSRFAKIFIFVLIGFLLTGGIGIAVYFLRGGANIVSSRNIEMLIEGPTTLKGGELGEWRVVITNKNKVAIELADFFIEYPEGAKPVSDSEISKSLRERRQIGQIDANMTIVQSIKAYLFGEKDSEKLIKLALEYRSQGSNAILVKEKEYLVKLLQSPLEISFKTPSEANSGEFVTLEIEIVSNAKTLIRDVNLKLEYPGSFRYSEAEPKPSFGENIWRLGDLEAGKKRSLKIKGLLQGQDLMELVFKASAGPFDEKGEVEAYGFAVSAIILRKPFLALSLAVNSREEETVASAGQTLNIDINWRNTLSQIIRNAVIEAKIKSPAADQRSISITDGFYRSFDQALIWNSSSMDALNYIEPLGAGRAQFKFVILDPLPAEVMTAGNPIISLDIEMRGERITEEGGSVEIKNRIAKDIKIASRFLLGQKGLYYSGPFKNTGSLPPKVGQETTYTVIWSLTNSVNDISEVTVKGFLPSYVKWLNKFSPENTDISYNQITGEVVWRLDIVPKGTGFSQPAKETAFQISFLPSASQIGVSPLLVSEATLFGKDVFTGAYLRDVKPAITINLDSDPQFKYTESRVAP
jgi:hypothetical protein